jgi:glucosylglycerol-phosphate synthase
MYKMKSDFLNLVVDLDGTFLESHLEASASTNATNQDPLYDFIYANRKRINLIFSTGRALESIRPVLSNPAIPTPDYIIGDVGATVVVVGENLELSPVTEIQSEIERRWPGSLRITEALRSVEGFENLVMQQVPQSLRCSYTFESTEFDLDSLQKKMANLGCEVLISANKYLDILVRNVTKGSTARQLLKLKDLEQHATLIAGDTLNDLSMFEMGFPAVAVGGSESTLLKHVVDLPHAYASMLPGTRGIIDGLLNFDMIEDASAKAPQVFGDSSLVMVYHRQPFDESTKGGKVVRKIPESPNGIIPTLLGFFTHGRPGSWVAWALRNNAADKFEQHVPVDTELYPALKAARIPLVKEDVDLFYKKFSKEAFWPIIFSFPSKVQINHDHWDHFKKINSEFAKQAAKEAAFESVVWIHDYNLWLVPGLLRQLRPDLKIGFFHHTSFPTPDIFNILPWREEIIGSLIQCDHIGFHIPRYVENFIDVARSIFDIKVLERTSAAPRFQTYGCALGVDSYASKIEIAGRTTTLGAHPVGIDLSRIRNSFLKPRIQKALRDLESELNGRTVILSVERLDYVKGPIEKIEAFERLLESRPDLHEKVVLINIVTPPAPGMEVYRQTREKLDQAIGRINGRFANVKWTPIRYFYKSFPFEDLLAFYAAADVAWITPLRDGLNLVCKEFVAVKGLSNRVGTLILSEFAGASVEMRGALLTNAFDLRDMVTTLERAIGMEPEEQTARMRQLLAIVRDNDVKSWGQEFLRHLGDEGDLADSETA